jgi:hypothetical protein
MFSWNITDSDYVREFRSSDYPPVSALATNLKMIAKWNQL